MGAKDGCLSDPKNTRMEFRGRASALQLKRVLADPGGGNMNWVNYVDEVLEQCDVCCSFDKAPHAPLAGASAVPIFYEGSQVDPSSLCDLTAFRAMGVFSKYFPLMPVRQRNLQEVLDAIHGAWIGFFGQLKCVQWADGGG